MKLAQWDSTPAVARPQQNATGAMKATTSAQLVPRIANTAPKVGSATRLVLQNAKSAHKAGNLRWLRRRALHARAVQIPTGLDTSVKSVLLENTTKPVSLEIAYNAPRGNTVVSWGGRSALNAHQGRYRVPLEPISAASAQQVRAHWASLRNRAAFRVMLENSSR